MTAVLRWLHGREVTIARYEMLLRSAATARALVAGATQRLDRTRAAIVRASDGARWLDTGLRHNRAESTDHTGLLTTRQSELWEWFASLRDGAGTLAPPDKLMEASEAAHAVVAKEQRRSRLGQEALAKDRELSALTRRLSELQSRVQRAEAESARLSHVLDEQQAQAASAVAGEREARDQLAVILGSRSWRLTSPARTAGRLVKPGADETRPPADSAPVAPRPA